MNCPFCHIDKKSKAFETSSFVVIWDKYPVTPHHALVIPKRHVADAQGLTKLEWAELHDAFAQAKAEILLRDSAVEGFNLGFNVGEVAGQTVMHAHFHVIPRRRGDVADPRGGIRGVIPGKQRY